MYFIKFVTICLLWFKFSHAADVLLNEEEMTNRFVEALITLKNPDVSPDEKDEARKEIEVLAVSGCKEVFNSLCNLYQNVDKFVINFLANDLNNPARELVREYIKEGLGDFLSRNRLFIVNDNDKEKILKNLRLIYPNKDINGLLALKTGNPPEN